MKKIISLLGIFVVSLLVVFAFASCQKDTELVFNLIDGKKEYTVVSVKTANKDLHIPSEYNNLPVTEISESAFAGEQEIVNVYIPDSVVVIGDRAFEDCINLKNLILPKKLEVIPSCMAINTSITSIDIPDYVKRIESQAFYATEIKDLVIPDSVEYIGYEAFGSSGIETVVIGKEIQEIQPYAFHYCNALKSVKFTNPTNIYLFGVIFQDGFLENPENLPLYFLDEQYACRHWFAIQENN